MGDRGRTAAARRPTASDPLFILGAPRSFTSVTCAMLGQHPQMYGLPELHPFVAATIAGRVHFQAQRRFNIDAGLLRVVAELFFGGQTTETVQHALGWLERHATSSPKRIIEQIAEAVSPRILVEKSPSTPRAMHHLHRAATMFPQARFLHLVRHPRTQCESLMAMPVRPQPGRDRTAPSADRPPIGMKSNPQRLWLRVNRNVCRFLRWIPAARQRRVRGEDLLNDPDTHLREIVEWLNLRTDAEAIAAMKHPENSPYACFGPPGAEGGNDPLFLERPALRPSSTRSSSLRDPLPWSPVGACFGEGIQQLARRFGYE